MILPVLITKFMAAGAVAQAATGATLAVVVFTGVGVAGALPDRVQDTVATVVADVTPLELPTSEESTEEVVPEKVDVEVVGSTAEVPGSTDGTPAPIQDAAAVEAEIRAWALEGPAEGEAFGAWVGEGSKDLVKEWLRARGMTFGNVVSAWANGKGLSDEQLAALGAEIDEPIDVPVVPAPEEAAPVVPEPEVAAPQPGTTGATGATGHGKKADSSSDGSRTSNGNGNAGGNGNAKGNGRN